LRGGKAQRDSERWDLARAGADGWGRSYNNIYSISKWHHCSSFRSLTTVIPHTNHWYLPLPHGLGLKN
jgi:hypothetical protein